MMDAWEIESDLAKWDAFAIKMIDGLEGNDRTLFEDGSKETRARIQNGETSFRQAMTEMLKGTTEELRKRAASN